MEIEEIKALIELFERSSLGELMLERGEARLVLRRPSQTEQSAAPLSAVASVRDTTEPRLGASTPATGEVTDEAEAEHLIRSPIVGTFYRQPSPEEEPYVKVGDHVDAGDTVCIVEAMKVMNEVRTERAGIVKEILVADATPVEYGQPLIAIALFKT